MLERLLLLVFALCWGNCDERRSLKHETKGSGFLSYQLPEKRRGIPEGLHIMSKFFHPYVFVWGLFFIIGFAGRYANTCQLLMLLTLRPKTGLLSMNLLCDSIINWDVY